MVCHYHEKISLYQKLDPKTQQGKQFRAELQHDQYSAKMHLPTIPNLQDKIDNLEKLLKKPEYSKSETEYYRLKTSKKGRPIWYEFFNGPNSIIKLADHLKLIGWYNILYRQFSRSIHGQDIIVGKLSGDSQGYTEIAQIRHPKDAQTVCLLTILMCLNVFRTVINHYVPEKVNELGNWYLQEINPFLDQMSAGKILDVED